VSTRNKYAKAADILAGRGLIPATNFSLVDEWDKSHGWDDIDAREYELEERDSVSSGGPWPLKSHVSSGMVSDFYNLQLLPVLDSSLTPCRISFTTEI